MTNKKSGVKKKKNENEISSTSNSLKNTFLILFSTVIILLIFSYFQDTKIKQPPPKRKTQFRPQHQQKGEVPSVEPTKDELKSKLREKEINYEFIKFNLQNNTKHIISFEERIPGTSGHYKTKQFIIQKLIENNFDVELDSFSQDTVKGKVRFTNIIASHKKTKNRKDKIILGAHYDSKIFNDFKFLGVTDSIVSCSMLIEFARFIDFHVDKFKNIDFQLVFFDGEEAFKEWNENDSIYGAKHLSEKWKKENVLKNIQLFVLLDLIGTRDGQFKNNFAHHQTGTNQLYLKFIEIENELKKQYSIKSQKQIFKRDDEKLFIDDDHSPFMRNSVPIIHLIPSPFPKVWHTVDDNIDAVDWELTTDIQLILNIFISSIGVL
eukprot:gene12409-6076_t